MLLTTKGRFAVMALVDISLNGTLTPVTLADIASRQEIDIGYLEQIFAKLKKAGLVKSWRGPGGGYTLEKGKDQILISDVMLAVEENIQMTRCNSKAGGNGCRTDKSQCLTHHLWESLEDNIHQFLQSVSIADVCNKTLKKVA